MDLISDRDIMNSTKYRVFVCTKQREDRKDCCFNCGAIEIYQTFVDEIDRQQLANRVKIRQSGCLDLCESGTVVAVYRSSWQNFTWLPDKIGRKLRKLLFPNRHVYGHLKREDVPAIVEIHFGSGRPLKRFQIARN
jgi:(2Fe-2S) ferredoxin